MQPVFALKAEGITGTLLWIKQWRFRSERTPPKISSLPELDEDEGIADHSLQWKHFLQA